MKYIQATVTDKDSVMCLLIKLLFLFFLSLSREFLGQGWMKLDKNERTPYIMKTSQHFNDVST